MDFSLVNWLAVVAGTVAAFALGMAWFSPSMFGKRWASGSQDIQTPEKPPVFAMIVQFIGTFCLALVVGLTETSGALLTAIFAILAAALMVAGMDLFSQKSQKATMIDAGYILAGGVLMILAQGLL